MRQANDNSFVDLLNSIRVGKLKLEQLAILDARRIINDNNQHDEIVHIFPTLKLVDEYNTKMSEQIPKQEQIPSDPNGT